MSRCLMGSVRAFANQKRLPLSYFSQLLQPTLVSLPYSSQVNFGDLQSIISSIISRQKHPFHNQFLFLGGHTDRLRHHRIKDSYCATSIKNSGFARISGNCCVGSEGNTWTYAECKQRDLPRSLRWWVAQAAEDP